MKKPANGKLVSHFDDSFYGMKEINADQAIQHHLISSKQLMLCSINNTMSFKGIVSLHVYATRQYYASGLSSDPAPKSLTVRT